MEELLNEIKQLRSDVATQGVQFAVHNERQDSVITQVEKIGKTVYGNGKQGLTTRVAVLTYAVGIVGVVASAALGHVVTKMFS